MELVVVVAVLYFIPAVVAVSRKAVNTGPVIIVNVLLGWTFLGWVVALAMAFGQRRTQTLAVPGAMPAGWYPSPSEPGYVRWWDGTRWMPGNHARKPIQPPK